MSRQAGISTRLNRAVAAMVKVQRRLELVAQAHERLLADLLCAAKRELKMDKCPACGVPWCGMSCTSCLITHEQWFKACDILRSYGMNPFEPTSEDCVLSDAVTVANHDCACRVDAGPTTF